MSDKATKQSEISTYHKNAKEAGNRLSAYVTNSSIGAVAVYFLALTQHKLSLSGWEKGVVVVTLIAFVCASFLRLLELQEWTPERHLVVLSVLRPRCCVVMCLYDDACILKK